MRLNTKELINKLSGKNKAFITRVAKHQEERYGNVDIFSADVVGNQVTMDFGENWIEFIFNSQGKVIDTLGNGQGHKYHKSLESCAIELFNKYGKE